MRHEAKAEARVGRTLGVESVGCRVGCLGCYHNGSTKGGRARECKTASEILHGDYGRRLIAAKLSRGAVKSDVH